MDHSFRTTRQRFDEALDQAESAFSAALGVLDDLPSQVTSGAQARQVIEAHQALRDMLRAQQRRLEKL